MQPYCDSKEYIETQLDSLEKLSALVKSRRERVDFERRDKNIYYLNQWVVLGKYILTENGGICGLETEYDHVPKVALAHEFGKYHMVSWSSNGIPSSNDVCEICQGKFTLENANKALALGWNKDNTKYLYEHKRCHWIARCNDNRVMFTAIFSEAGFRNFYLHDIKNEYWPEVYLDVEPTWFRATTQFGDFTVGRRKRVINIDWSAVNYQRLKPLACQFEFGLCPNPSDH